MTRTLTITPFNRVQGDILVKVEIENGEVKSAHSSCTFLRGIEYILKGREPMDAIVITCRVCGYCSASHSAASSALLANAYGTAVPPNGILCRNIIQGIETVLSHLTHFYLAFMGDFTGQPYDEALSERFLPGQGRSFRKAIRARSQFLAMLGIMAGKWPNTLALQPGGTTKPLNSGEIHRASGVLAEFMMFMEEDMFGCALDEWLSIRSVDELDRWLDVPAHRESDVGAFIRLARAGDLEKLGTGPGRFLSGGGFPSQDGKSLWLKSGYYDGTLHELDVEQIEESTRYSWYEVNVDNSLSRLPECTLKPDKEDAYSWGKSVRYIGNPVEVGPLARMVISGEPLALDLLKKTGASAFARALMRVHEAAAVARQLERWVNEIQPREPFYVKEQPRDAKALALVPAPRGMLMHWASLKGGVIERYQIVTPTGWNFSPRDDEGRPGPVEQALAGTPVEEGSADKRIAHIVKSFDPCLYCSVH